VYTVEWVQRRGTKIIRGLDDQRAGIPLLGGQAETVGVVWPGEEEGPGTPYSSLPVPEGGLQESWGGTFYKVI